MNIEIHGTGRAAGALAIGASRAGHRIVGLFGRGGVPANPFAPSVQVVGGDADVRVIAVSDRAIGDVAAALVDLPPVPTVHVSGAEPVNVLDALAGAMPVGSFHPLQTLPTPEVGADKLPGAWIGITADPPLRETLVTFAESMGCHPFDIADDQKALYHAAAAATANFPLASLVIAEELYTKAGVPLEAAAPLVEAVVANAFELGPRAALTGPIARGDAGTVAKQVEAVRSEVPELADAFTQLAVATAAIAGTSKALSEVLP